MRRTLIALFVALACLSPQAPAAAGVDTTPPPVPTGLTAVDSVADPSIYDIFMDGEADFGGATATAAATLDPRRRPLR